MVNAAGSPTTCVVVATYMQPEALEMVLSALSAQSDRDFELLVADDGSNPPVHELVSRLNSELGLDARVLWQPDQGFCKARIQNEAALHTDAELLIFLDGDCVPFRNLVALYRRHARTDEFLTGGVCNLPSESTRTLTPRACAHGVHESVLTWRERARVLEVHWRNRLNLGGRLQRPSIRGGNFAVSAALFRRIDGFDETYCGYGKEDSDLRNRMRNAGATGISLSHRALVAHLARDVVVSASRRETAPRDLYEAGMKLVRARVGLSQHASAKPMPGRDSAQS